MKAYVENGQMRGDKRLINVIREDSVKILVDVEWDYHYVLAESKKMGCIEVHFLEDDRKDRIVHNIDEQIASWKRKEKQ